jgi:hypothetical protein
LTALFRAWRTQAGASYLLLDVSWRWVFVVTSIPTGLMALLRRNVPESPRYLLAQGEIEETEAVLQQVVRQAGHKESTGKISAHVCVWAPMTHCRVFLFVGTRPK